MRVGTRPVWWGALAALGAGMLVGRIATVFALVAATPNGGDLVSIAYAVGSPAGIFVAGFVAARSGGWRSVGVLAGGVLLISGGAVIFSRSAAVLATDLAFLALMLIAAGVSRFLAAGPPARLGVLDAYGAFELVGGVIGLVQVFIARDAFGNGPVASVSIALSLLAATVVLLRRSSRPVRDALILAAVLVAIVVIPSVLTVARSRGTFGSLAAATAATGVLMLVGAALMVFGTFVGSRTRLATGTTGTGPQMA